MSIRQEFREWLSEKELNEASKKIKDMDKDEIQGEIEYILTNAGEKIDSSNLSQNISKYMSYLKTEYGDKKLNKALAIKIAKEKL